MRKARPLIDADKVHAFLTGMFEQDLHARRVLSLANATTGVIHAASLSVHAQSRVSVPARRDRLFLISALAIALLTLLGAAGESLGFERLMKANTVKRRSYSLLRQGCHYYECIPAMKPEKLKLLLAKFADLVTAQSLFRDVFGLL